METGRVFIKQFLWFLGHRGHVLCGTGFLRRAAAPNEQSE
jgi:hypothetical protein